MYIKLEDKDLYNIAQRISEDSREYGTIYYSDLDIAIQYNLEVRTYQEETTGCYIINYFYFDSQVLYDIPVQYDEDLLKKYVRNNFE